MAQINKDYFKGFGEGYDKGKMEVGVGTELNDKKPVEVKNAVYEVILKEIEDSYEEVLELINNSTEHNSFNSQYFEKPFKRWLVKKFDLKLSKFI